MKKLIITTALLISLTSFSQTVKRDEKGNFYSEKANVVKHDSTTTFTFTDSKNETHTVYKTAKGKFYVARKSKTTGKYYRHFLKETNN